jgi:hypothetical protein
MTEEPPKKTDENIGSLEQNGTVVIYDRDDPDTFLQSQLSVVELMDALGEELEVPK